MAYINKINVDGVEYEVKDPNSATQATFDPDTGIVSFKNSSGKLLFELDLSELANVVYGDMSISVTELTVAEGGSGTFTIQLAEQPSGTQPVYLAVSDNSKISVEPAALTFNANNWNVPQTVTVTALQDEDQYDEDVSVTATSKKVEAKVVAITVSDDDKPSVVTDGLILHFDYTNKVDDTSDTITDLATGVTASGFSSLNKSVNGIRGNGTSIWLTPDTTTDAYNTFKQSFAEAANTGFAVEAFGNFYARMFFFNSSVSAGSYSSCIHTGTYSISADNAGGSTMYGAAPYINSSDESVVATTAAGKYFSDVENYEKYFHTVIVFGADGTITIYANGVNITKSDATAPEDFVSWDIDTIVNNFKLFTSQSNRFPTGDTDFLSAQRIYNRPLSQEEIIKNRDYMASKLGLVTF